jgi:(2Fe-2S) ferredoxin
MSYYQYHIFCCLNQRAPEESCCAHSGAEALFDYAKSKMKSLGLSGAGKIRVNRAGCLDRCDYGPVWVVYPDETWYTVLSTEDVDEIIESHLIQGKKVDRLLVEKRV